MCVGNSNRSVINRALFHLRFVNSLALNSLDRLLKCDEKHELYKNAQTPYLNNLYSFYILINFETN